MSKDPSETDSFELRWPQEGDQLFVESSWSYDARVTGDPKERFYRMPMGYKRAGDILIDQARTDLVDRRNIIYAALFCYRQSIELFLKQLIDEFGKDKNFSPKNTHDLNRLWERFVCIANEKGGCESIGFIEAQKLIGEMQNFDQKSDGFRFPADIRDEPFFSHDKGIDLNNVREVMQGLENFFECFYLDWNNQN
jgi:HEPN domain-containing protein